LTTTTVLLRKLDWHSLDDDLVGTLEGGKEDTITIHDDEAKLLVIFEQSEEGLGEEGVLALISVGVEWLVWLQVVGDLLLSLVVFHKNDTTE
jgi:hypothetical protein